MAWRTGGAEDVDFSQFFGDRFGGEAPGGFGDIFSQFRQAKGGRKRGAASQAKRGADLATEVEIPFATAIVGGEVQLSIRRESGETETIVVKIPVGIEDGKKIRLRGHGEPAPARRHGRRHPDYGPRRHASVFQPAGK